MNFSRVMVIMYWVVKKVDGLCIEIMAVWECMRDKVEIDNVYRISILIIIMKPQPLNDTGYCVIVSLSVYTIKVLLFCLNCT